MTEFLMPIHIQDTSRQVVFKQLYFYETRRKFKLRVFSSPLPEAAPLPSPTLIYIVPRTPTYRVSDGNLEHHFGVSKHFNWKLISSESNSATDKTPVLCMKTSLQGFRTGRILAFLH
ncbi:hypothetical protein GCK32_020485 [Trichostrongylus colubriformis]|uniref:Uncharacterized protein n=1 Tax=Trichostrongylus colubriformis TaxID=6319 RepID=A0AAN8J2Y4_TRICO